MKKIYFALFIFTIGYLNIFSQTKTASIYGYIRDSKTNEALIGATVYDLSSKKGGAANSYGYFSVSLPLGKVVLKFSLVGYEPVIKEIALSENLRIDITLTEKQELLNEVVISAKKEVVRNKNEFASVNISPISIEKIPLMFGDNDIVKAIQFQSGVKNTSEGSSGMFVRGGNLDQNLVLIDEAPIYNVSHIMGLVSVLNTDAVKDIVFHKGMMPAQYGGRLSSVVECYTKEGNAKSFKLSGGLGVLTSHLTLEGPLVKEKVSFIATARRSIFDLFYNKSRLGIQIEPSFYDVNIKLNAQLNKNNRIYFSVFNSEDQIETVDSVANLWKNRTATLRWSNNIGAKLFTNVSLIYSKYQNNLVIYDKTNNFSWETGIEDLNAKADVSYYFLPGNKLRFGAGTVLHQYKPGEQSGGKLNIARVNALEHSAYLLHDINLGTKLGLNYGIRFNMFQNIGKATWHEYQNYLPVAEKNNTDGVYNTFWNIEPRISLNYTVSPLQSIKAAYARTSQFVHLLQVSANSYSALETWMPANPNIKPQLADNYSLGWFANLFEQYEVSLQAYYRQMYNQIDFIAHAQIVQNPYIGTIVRTGENKAYGIEADIAKNGKKISGSLSYSYSKVISEIEGINDGKPYPALWDMPHDLRINLSWQIKKRFSVSANWVYNTGKPITFPVGFYLHDRTPIPIYPDRNSQRVPDYHRLDVGLKLDFKPNKLFSKSSFTFGIYNAYLQKNVLSYRYSDYPWQNDGKTYVGVENSVFLFAVPSLSFKFVI